MFIENLEFIKDGLKIGIIFLPLIYFLVKGRNVIGRHKGLFFLIVGFSIMLFAGILDFTDEFPVFANLFLVGANFPYHESIEDVLGIIGFVLFALGIATEIKYVIKENNEKKKMIQKLEEQAVQLKRFDELKSKFVRDVSHEFSSPLTSIKSSIKNIIDGLMGDVTNEQKQYLNIGKKNLDRLLRLITDMLTLSKIESGNLEINRKFNSMSSLAQEAYLSLKIMFENKGISFKKVCDLDNSDVWCDADKITQVFVNIFSNGLKYSSSNTRISTRISIEGENIKVEIEDQGKGMSQDDIEKLFNRFLRLDAEKEEGTGLGLVISKEIITMHQGKIWVESKLNQGTKFIFTIPKDLRNK